MIYFRSNLLSFFLLALSLAASIFESNGNNNDNLADTNTELHILGVKYKTRTGELR
jgi:hypothetical protein